jgi:hypothetical protein
MASVFFSYSHKDEALRDELEKHLAMLRREGAISAWHDRRITAGEDFSNAINEELQKADVILLLVSSDFLSSEYCYSVEMRQALDRHERKEVVVIPIILRPCDWHSAPFGHLLALPSDGKPITKWTNLDEAFFEVAKGIRAALSKMGTKTARQHKEAKLSAPNPNMVQSPRSSNLRVRRQFSDHDRDVFQEDAFAYISRYFENSLQELQSRNPGIKCEYKRIDGNRFNAAVYRDGKVVARCTVRIGGIGGSGIALSLGTTTHSENSFNESLSVIEGDQALQLRPLGMGARGGISGDSSLSEEGAAEYYWSMFVEPLQR